jgi:transposase
LAWAKKASAWIVVEPTGTYHLPLVLAAQEAGIPVCLVPPADVRKYARLFGWRSKTDRLDAQLILKFALTLEAESRLKPLPELDPKQLYLKKLIGQRELLVGHRVAMCQCGISRSLIDEIEKEIKSLEKQIHALCLDHGNLYKRLLAIPFVGPISAAHLVALLWVPDLFPSAKAIVAFCGLDIVLKHSGRYKGESKLSKRGWPSLRRSLAAGLKGAGTKRCGDNPVIRMMLDYTVRTQNPLHWAGAASAVSRKILQTAWSMVKYDTEYDPKRLNNRAPRPIAA